MVETDSGTVQRAKVKYQVFISSTWDDLHEVRAAVTWEVLAAGHIPAGMENFPAADERGWDTIRRTIDRSDYYLLIVGGRYGTYDESIGKSWTQREYEYARSRRIPVLAFIREADSILSTQIDKDEANRKRLGDFISTIAANHLKKHWTTATDLTTKVVQALQWQIANDEEDGKPRPGWYRGDQIASAASMDEFARLSSENAELRAQLEKLGSGKELLAVTTTDGDPLTDHAVVISPIRVAPGAPGSYMPFQLRPEDVQRYAVEMSQTVWLRLRVTNSGNRAARGLAADFNVRGVESVVIRRPEAPHPAGIGRPAVARTPAHLDPASHCQVALSRTKDGVAEIRQRVKYVAAGGGNEELISMGFCVAARPTQLTVDYVVRSEDGVTLSGTFSVSVTVGSERFMSEEQLMKLKL